MADTLYRIEVTRQGRGLELKKSPLTAAPGECIVADNCDRDTTFAIRKRNGNVLYDDLTTHQRVVGIHNYEYLSGGETPLHQHLYIVDDGALWYRDENMTTATYAGGFWDKTTDSSLKRAVFAQTPAGETYIGAGEGRMTVWTGTSRCYAGITNPTNRPTGTPIVPVGSGLTGDYYLKYTYIYKTRDGRVIESNPSGKNTTVAAPAAQAIRWQWSAPDIQQNGERINGYRLYRTYANADKDVGPYSFLTEIDDINVIYYDDEIEDVALVSPNAPTDHNTPPVGPGPILYYQNCLFMFGSKENPHRIRFTKLGPNEGEYEHWPASYNIDVPKSSTAKFTGAVLLNGVAVVLDEDGIGHITGTSPDNFVYRRMNTYTGCVAPGSVRVVGNYVIFRGRTGFYSWDGATLRYLSKAIEPALEDNAAANAMDCLSASYVKRTHCYFPEVGLDGQCIWWVYDFDVGGSQDYTNTGSADDNVTRAWFRYVGKNDAIRATAIETVRQFGSREEMVLWGDASGRLFRFDQGFLDYDQPIEMTYSFWVLPQSDERASPIGQYTVWRYWTPFIDQWEGTAYFGWGWWNSPFSEPGGIFDEESLSRPTGNNERPRINMRGYGVNPFLVRIRHTDSGAFRVLGHEFWYRPFKRGLRGASI